MLLCSTWPWRRKLSCGACSGRTLYLNINTLTNWLKVEFHKFLTSFPQNLYKTISCVFLPFQVSAWWKDDSVLQEQLQRGPLEKGSSEKCFLPAGKAALWTVSRLFPAGRITQRRHRGANTTHLTTQRIHRRFSLLLSLFQRSIFIFLTVESWHCLLWRCVCLRAKRLYR